MIHAREDYNRIQDPALEDPSLLGEGCTPIAEGEPVLLFRAQDKHFLGVLEDYEQRLLDDELMNSVERERMVDTLREHYNLAFEWQRVNECKEPDLPGVK